LEKERKTSALAECFQFDPLRVPSHRNLGYRKIIIESLEILKTIEPAGEQRVEAVAWPFLLSLPAVHPMVTVPTMFYERAAVLPVVAIVAAIQEGSIRIQFQQLFATRLEIKLHLQQWARASAAPRAPREQLVH
jgi:hypothetical protein